MYSETSQKGLKVNSKAKKEKKHSHKYVNVTLSFKKNYQLVTHYKKGDIVDKTLCRIGLNFSLDAQCKFILICFIHQFVKDR